MSFTSEEIWQEMRKIDSSLPESVFLSSWPDMDGTIPVESLCKKWEQVLSVRGGISRALESARAAGIIGHSLDAEVDLLSSEENMDSVTLLQEDEWAALAIVSSFNVLDSFVQDGFSWKDEETGIEFKIRKAPGEKCPRCWKRSVDVLGDSVCPRCQSVLEG